LWTLHDLDILDKHRMIVPVFSFSPLIVTEEGSTQPMAFGQSFLPKLRRGEVHKERVLPNMKFKDNYKPVIFVFLDDSTCGFPREDVFGTLRRLERGVIDTIEALAREYATLRREGVIEKAPKDLVI